MIGNIYHRTSCRQDPLPQIQPGKLLPTIVACPEFLSFPCLSRLAIYTLLESAFSYVLALTPNFIMTPLTIRRMVGEFREQNGFAGAEEHCFAPWYMHQAYHLPRLKALAQSSDGNYDFGIDGFHLADGPKLILVQAKLTESLQLIAKGFKELERGLHEIARSLEGIGTEGHIQNKVLVNLSAVLNRLTPEERLGLVIELEVVHLSPVDDEVLANTFREVMGRLKEAVEHALPNNTCHIRQIGPGALGPAEVLVVPPEESPLRLRGFHEFSAGECWKMITGIGHLADLVDLYKVRRDDLFSRNVRYYLNSTTNTKKGAAGKMRATLKAMCVEGKVEPERFAPFHNGVTIFAKRAVLDGDGVRLRDPYVLNGCQTIKNAFFFRYDDKLQNKIKNDLWDRVSVPIRIIETGDGELVRTITVNNNRQNAMSPAALRANDEVQIRIEKRFKNRGIFYQRQEGALDAIKQDKPQLLEDEYVNSQGNCVDIDDLACAIAASRGNVIWAQRPKDLFESDNAYGAVFDEKRTLRSVVFLTFLQNLHDVVGLVLKMDLKLAPKTDGPKPTRFRYETICLLTRYLAREGNGEFVVEWGTKLYGRKEPFREEIRKILNSTKSRIRVEFNAAFMTLERGTSTTEAFEKCQKNLKLGEDIDPFAIFAELDE